LGFSCTDRGQGTIQRFKDEIDGVNILVAFVFVAAVMENVASRIVEMPLKMLGLGALGFVVFFVVFGATTVTFIWAGRDRAFALGFMASQRNMGLMLAATGSALPDLTWIYFAACQFPIYLTPQLLKPLARRLVKPDQDGQCSSAS
jgi:BASS family bile acid:Na+ symporter